MVNLARAILRQLSEFFSRYVSHDFRYDFGNRPPVNLGFLWLALICPSQLSQPFLKSHSFGRRPRRQRRGLLV